MFLCKNGIFVGASPNLSESGYYFRLIDPIAQNLNNCWLLRNLFTPSYNPKAEFEQHADTIGLALVILEIMTGIQPFEDFLMEPGNLAADYCSKLKTLPNKAANMWTKY